MPRILICLFLIFSVKSVGLTQSVLPDEKRVVYYAEDLSLEDALVSLSKKSGINIAYNTDIIPDDITINLIAKSKPVGQIIDYMLNGTELKYTIVGNQIVIEQDQTKVKNAQSEVTVSGIITDKLTGEVLPYASVYTHDKTIGTASNDYGKYNITIPAGEAHLYYSYIGYQLDIVDLELAQDSVIIIELIPLTQLNEVLILDDPINQEVSVNNTINVPIKLLSAMVPLAGESDVLRYIQLTPGVTAGADGVGGLSIRGGNVEHNLFLLDGVPIYQANHALGLFSVFNNYAIKNSVLHKSSFPAKFGGRLASVTDIRTKEGNINEFGGEVGIGTITGKFSIEGPIEKGKSSFIVSARRTFLDPFISSLSNVINQQSETSGDRKYRFYDIFSKVNFRLNDDNRLFVTLFNGSDRFTTDITSEGMIDDGLLRTNRLYTYNTNNTLAAVKWNSSLSNTSFLRTNLYFTSYNLEAFELFSLNTMKEFDPDILTYDGGYFDSTVRDVGLQLDYDKVYESDNVLSIGLHAVSHLFTPGILTADEKSEIVTGAKIPTSTEFSQNFENARLGGSEIRLYGQYDLKYGRSNVFSFGLNQAIHISQDGKVYFIPEPRVSLLQLVGNTQLRFSYSRLSQFSHRISTSSLGWPLDIWVPTTELIAPQTSSLFNIGLVQPIGSKSEFSIEGYYRILNNLTNFNPGANIDISRNSNWEFLIPIGQGRAYGIETTLNKKLGKLITQLNYTLAYSNRTFEDINLGRTFPYRFDRRHSIKTTLLYRINDNAEIAANWLFASGNPTSLPSVSIIENGEFIFIFDEINGYRLAPFHRFDFAFNFYNELDWANIKFSIGAYNAYNRANPFFLDVIPQNGDGMLRQFSILPIIPSLSVNFQF